MNNIEKVIFGLESFEFLLSEADKAVKSGVKIPYATAYSLAVELQGILRKYCSIVRFSGSLRRRKSEVGDIDMVVQLKPNVSPQTLRTELSQVVQNLSGGDSQLSFHFKDVVVNLFIRKSDMPMGALMMRTTGPLQSNIGLSAKAKKFGYTLSQYGLRDASGKLIAGTERGIRKALGTQWKEPRDRG